MATNVQGGVSELRNSDSMSMKCIVKYCSDLSELTTYLSLNNVMIFSFVLHNLLLLE